MSQSNNEEPNMVVVYDGDCPFCKNYIRMMRLKDAAGKVLLVNAREGGFYVQQVVDQGMDLDEGMALLYGGKWYYGAECLHVLALMSSSSDWFNKLTASLFKSQERSRRWYPFLKAGRNAALFLLGREKINMRKARK